MSQPDPASDRTTSPETVAASTLTPSRLHRPQLSDEVADNLRSAIMSKRLRPGSFIRLHDTAARLGVSITPVREALVKLGGEGLVQREPHRGYVVLPLSGQDIGDICWLQDTIAAELLATISDRITGGQIDELERINNKLTMAVASAEPEAISAAELSFHEVLGHASGRAILARFLLGAQRYLHAQIDIADPQWGKAAIDDHRRLIAALRGRDTAAASHAQVALPETSTVGGDFNPVASQRGKSTSAPLGIFHQQPHPEIAGRQEKTIGVGQLRSDTLGYFDRVAAGEIFDVVRRGKIAARIIPDMRESKLAGAAPASARSAKRIITTRVALDDLRTLAGRYLDRVAAGETLEIIQGGEIVGLVISPERD